MVVPADTVCERYEIRIQGKLDEKWLVWLGGAQMSVTAASHPPVTVLVCAIDDQARLRGLLNRLWDLNLSLISVQRLDDPAENAPLNSENGWR